MSDNEANQDQARIPSVDIGDNLTVPQLGFGTWNLSDDEAYTSVREAITVGYRLIDTAAIYGNEAGVGRAIADSIAAGEVARDELIITTKLWNSDQGKEEAFEAFEASRQKLGLDYIDLYLLHWPCPDYGRYVEAYAAMNELKNSERLREIGVCNFYPEALDRLRDDLGLTPAVNQIEIHPGFSQVAQRADDAGRGIVTESWSPLGQGASINDPVVKRIAGNHNVTAGQVILRWHLQLGLVVIPRSSNPERIAQNFDIAGFTLSDEEMTAINDLDSDEGRIGPDPREMNSGTPVDGK